MSRDIMSMMVEGITIDYLSFQLPHINQDSISASARTTPEALIIDALIYQVETETLQTTVVRIPWALIPKISPEIAARAGVQQH